MKNVGRPAEREMPKTPTGGGEVDTVEIALGDKSMSQSQGRPQCWRRKAGVVVEASAEHSIPTRDHAPGQP